MNVKVIFPVLILASVLVVNNISGNLAHAIEKDPQVGASAFQRIVDDLMSVIDEIQVILDTLRIDFNTEVEARTNADIDRQAQIDDLRILYQSETEAATTATISPYYSNTLTVTTAPSSRYAETLSCEDGDIAISSNLVKL